MKKIGIFLVTLINLTALAPAMDQPLGTLQRFPVEMGDRLGEYLTPKDVLVFQETCKTAREKFGILMMNQASLVHPVRLEFDFIRVEEAEILNINAAEGLSSLSFSAVLWLITPQPLIDRVKPLSNRVMSVIGFKDPRVERLLACQNAGAMAIDLCLTHMDLGDLKEFLPYCKHIRSITFEFNNATSLFQPSIKELFLYLSETVDLYEKLVFIKVITNTGEVSESYCESIFGDKFYHYKLTLGWSCFEFINNNWEKDFLTQKYSRKNECA